MGNSVRYGVPVVLLIASLLGGCVGNRTNLEPGTYSATEARQPARVERGVVRSVEEVRVTDPGTEGGTLVGGVVGGGLGSQLGGGSGRTWTTIAGAVLGGVAGEKLTRFDETAYAYIVELGNGETLQVVQQGALIPPNTPVLIKRLGGGRAVLEPYSGQPRHYGPGGDSPYRR